MAEYSDIDEKELIEQLEKGLPEAFNVLFKLYQPSLVFFANRLLMNADLMDAEEVVQDVFVKLYAKPKPFESLTHIKSFLYLVTKNACLDRIAKDKVHMRRFESFISTFDESEEAIDTQIIYAELLSEIKAGIELLPDKCRFIMKQFLEEGRNAQEIAKEMNISVSTVNNQRSRAIGILRNKLSNRGLSLLISILFS